MRFFFAAAALLAGLTAMGQNAYELVQGVDTQTPVENGTNIKMEAERTSWTKSKDQLKWEPMLFVKANTACSVTVTFKPQNGSWQCCYPTNCFQVAAGETFEQTGDLAAGSLTNMQIHCTELVKKGETTENVFTASLQSSGSGVTYDVTLETVPPELDAIENTVVASSFICCNGKTLNYNMKDAAVLTIYNVYGAAMMSVPVVGNGSMNLDLPAGVYVYTTGKTAGKLFVK